MSVQSLGIVETSSVECPDSYAVNYLEFVMRIVVHSSILELDLLSETSYHMPSVRGVLYFTFTLL